MEEEREMIWEKIIVDWIEEYKVWTVGAYDQEGNRESLADHHRKEWALNDAMIYAFDVQCGPQRAPKIEVYTKTNRLIKTIESSKK